MPILSQLEAVLILCTVAVWISRVPYLVGKGRIGRVLLTVPDQTGPRITIPAGVLLVAAGLFFIAATHARPSLLPYVGLGIVLLGVALGLNFLFPTQVGTGGILEPYGGLCTWDNIESYSWSEDGKVLELQLHRSIFFRKRSLVIPAPFSKDIADYLSHRLWGSEQPPLPVAGPSEG